MKHMKKITLTLLTAMVLVAVLMTGCTKPTEVKNNTPSTTDAPAETGEYGVYIRLARDDVSSVYIHGGSISKDYENADGSALNAGEWVFTGEEIAELSKKDNCSVLFTVGAVTAEKIVRYREEHGAFQSKEDLKKVPSIGESRYQKMADQITL